MYFKNKCPRREMRMPCARMARFEPRSSDRKSEMIGYPQRTTTYVDFLNPDYTTGAIKICINNHFLKLLFKSSDLIDLN